MAIERERELLELVGSAIKRDEALRVHFQVGDKFRFIRDQLRTLYEQIEKHTRLLEIEEEKKVATGPSEDEQLVYVYLYNAQGLVVSTWQNMITPKLFYEYSVNRPVYAEKSHIESLIKSKANKAQHGFLTVIVNRNDIADVGDTPKLDVNGNAVIKIREGKLLFNRFVNFTHNDIEYVLNEDGKMINKEEP
jgi:hypothetical protein